MQWHNENKYTKEEYIERVVKRVHFFPDRYDIRLELANHIEDSKAEISESFSTDSSPEEIEKEALSRMGDPDKIGAALNREHNPIIGYLWYFSRIPLVLLSIVIGLQLLTFILFTGWGILFVHPVKDIPKSEYLRSIKPNEKIVVDDSRIKITHIIQTKDGTLHVCYSSYNFSSTALHGWTGDLIGTIKDEDGNYYHTGGGSNSGGLYRKGRWGIKDFPLDKDIAILEYGAPDRYFKLEFNLGKVADQ